MICLFISTTNYTVSLYADDTSDRKMIEKKLKEDAQNVY